MRKLFALALLFIAILCTPVFASETARDSFLRQAGKLP